MRQRLRVIWSRCREALRKDRLDAEFDEELRTHLELLVEEGQRNGLSQTEARQQALRKLGRPELLRELHREQRGIPLLELLAQDLRYAVRMLAKSPGFAGVAVLSLALSIGANTALFSLVDGLLLRSLPVRAPERLVQVEQALAAMGIRKAGGFFPKPVFEAVRGQDVFSEIVGFTRLDRPAVVIDGATEPGRQVEAVSENFFRDLGVVPVLGRAPDASDHAVAVLSHRFWRTRFDSDSVVVGRSLSVDGRLHTIVGVAPPRFLGLSIESSPDLWISSGAGAEGQMIARLKPGVSSQQAQAALSVLFPLLAQQHPDSVRWENRMEIAVQPAGKGLSQLRAQYDRPLLALLALVTLVLLMTCANVGSLLTVRNAARRRELTLRAALGARRSRLVVQCLVESVVLAGLGGVFALAVARSGVSILLSMLPVAEIPESLAFHADARVLGFAALVSLLSALLFGLAPAWRATQLDLIAALRAGQGSTLPKGARRLGRSLVACQVGLSVLLLVAAGLFVQTLRNLTRFDLGFDPDGLLQVSIDTRGAGYAKGQVGAVGRLVVERVAAIPGVHSVAAVRNPVLRGGLSRTSFRSLGPGRPLGPDEAWDSANVGPGFFETMRIRVLRGRVFTADDFAQEQPRLVVSEAFAKHYFPDLDPIGQIGGALIGVVADTKLSSLRRESGPMMYMMAGRELDRIDALEVRAAGDPDALARAIGQELRRVHPRLFVGVRTMRQEFDRSIAKERMVAATSAFFSLLGLLLTSVGIFGVASATVAQRTNELGIRMALGASRWSVIGQSLRDTMLVFAVGLCAGIAAAVAAVRLTAGFVSELLFGLTATDSLNIAVAVLVMAGVAVAACVLPARRATRIDPLAAIRCE